MKDSEVYNAVVRWLNSVLTMPVHKANLSNKLPPKPYGVANLINVSEVRQNAQSEEYDQESNGDIVATPVIETEWHFSLHAYGESPTDLLRPLRAAAQLSQMNEPLMPALIIHEVSAIRNIPDWVEGVWEPRANLDLFIRGVVRDGFVIDTIEEFSVGAVQVNRANNVEE